MKRIIVGAVALTVALGAQACLWDKPGVNPVTVYDPASLVDNYKDIPADVRERLKAKMRAFDYDEVAAITRDSIGGGRFVAMKDMHFGDGILCPGAVDLSRWEPWRVERMLVYRVDGHVIGVPTICRNVSRLVPALPKALLTVPPEARLPELPGGAASGVRNTVSEPSAFALVLLALALMRPIVRAHRR